MDMTMTGTLKPTIEYLDTTIGTLRVIMRNSSAEVEVPSRSGGPSCIVTVTRSFVSGTCSGFHYRGKCWHTDMIRKTLTGV
jgi:hypothetical protein